MRLTAVLMTLAVAGCSVGNMTDRHSGVGFSATDPMPAEVQPTSSDGSVDYRARLLQDMPAS